MNATNEKTLPSKPNPRRFPGTVSYGDNIISRTLFFGRDEEAKGLLHLILSETFVVLYARSGNGKTSLLQAKVFESLREKFYYPILIRLNKAGTSPEEAIQTELTAINQQPNFELLENCSPKDVDFLQFLQNLEIWSKDDKLYEPVIILDQFEEFFTLEHNLKYRTSFLNTLAAILKKKKEGLIDIKIVIAIREDFFGHLKKMSASIPSIFTNTYRLEPIGKKKVKEVICGPSSIDDGSTKFESDKFTFSDTALKQLEDFLSLKKEEELWQQSEEIEPIQLQIICSELEDMIINGDIKPVDGKIEIKETDYGGESGLKNILGEYYTKQLKKLKDKEKLGNKTIKKIREIIEQELIAGSKRVPLAYETFVQEGGEIKKGIDFLILNKLLKVEVNGNNSLVEICHDTLVEPILKYHQIDLELKKKNQAFKYIALSVLVFIVLIGFLSYQNNRAAKKITMAEQEQSLLVATQIKRTNPSLAFNIAFSGFMMDTSNKSFATLFANFDTAKYAYAEKRYRASGSIIYFATITDNDYCFADNNTIYRQHENGLFDTAYNSNGAIIGAGAVLNNNHYFIIKKLNTAEIRDKDYKLITKFLISSSAQQASVSPNGRYFIIDNYLYRYGKNEPVFKFNFWGQLKQTMQTIFTSDNKYIISCHKTSDILVQDTTGKVVKVFSYGDPNSVVNTIAYSESLKQIISACNVPIIKTWDYTKINDNENLVRDYDFMKTKFEEGHTAAINCVAISPSNKFILTGSNDKTAILWKWDGTIISILKGHNAKITFVGFKGNADSLFVTGDEAGNIMTWKMGNSVNLVKNGELLKFSPLEYRSVGLSEKNHSFGDLYDTSSYKAKIAAVLDYTYSFPEINAYPEDKSYLNAIDTSFKELDKLYVTIFSNDSFFSISPTVKKQLYNNYSNLVLKIPKLLRNTQENDTAQYARLSNYYDLENKELLIGLDDIDKAITIKNKMINISIDFANSTKFTDSVSYTKKYNWALNYAEKAKNLLNKFSAKYPDNKELKIELGNCYGAISWYKLITNKPLEAIDNAEKGISFDTASNKWIYTNLALGHLLSNHFKEAEDIYQTYKSKQFGAGKRSFKDAFMTDFTDLENAGIISKDNVFIYNEVQKIKKLLDNTTATFEKIVKRK